MRKYYRKFLRLTRAAGRRSLDRVVRRLGYVPQAQTVAPRSKLRNLQLAQRHMRDPERKWVCDILANGYTESLPPNGALSTGGEAHNKHE